MFGRSAIALRKTVVSSPVHFVQTLRHIFPQGPLH